MNSPLSFPQSLTPFVALSPNNETSTEAPISVDGLLTSAVTGAVNGTGATATGASANTSTSGSPWYVALAQYGGLALLGVILVALGAYALVKD